MHLIYAGLIVLIFTTLPLLILGRTIGTEVLVFGGVLFAMVLCIAGVHAALWRLVKGPPHARTSATDGRDATRSEQTHPKLPGGSQTLATADHLASTVQGVEKLYDNRRRRGGRYGTDIFLHGKPGGRWQAFGYPLSTCRTLTKKADAV